MLYPVFFPVRTRFFNIVNRSLHDVHEMNGHTADHVCPSVRCIQLDNSSTDLDEISCGRYAIGSYPKVTLFNIP
jgi:hypothetical protein